MVMPIKYITNMANISIYFIPSSYFFSLVPKDSHGIDMMIQIFKKIVFSVIVYAIHADVPLSIADFGVGYFKRYKIA